MLEVAAATAGGGGGCGDGGNGDGGSSAGEGGGPAACSRQLQLLVWRRRRCSCKVQAGELPTHAHGTKKTYFTIASTGIRIRGCAAAVHFILFDVARSLQCA